MIMKNIVKSYVKIHRYEFMYEFILQIHHSVIIYEFIL